MTFAISILIGVESTPYNVVFSVSFGLCIFYVAVIYTFSSVTITCSVTVIRSFICTQYIKLQTSIMLIFLLLFTWHWEAKPQRCL